MARGTTTTRSKSNGGATAEGKAKAEAAVKKAMKNPASSPVPLEEEGPAALDVIREETLYVPILGVTPFIINRFSEKAKRKMLDDAQGKKTPKTPKDPQAEFEGAFYRLANGDPGFPADGFKQATVGAARFYGKDISMTGLKQFIFIHGEIGDDGRALVPIISPNPPKMREDVVRVGRGTADLRYRPEFFPWSAVLVVTYFPTVLRRESVLSLIDIGGLACGVGEWRPGRDGTFGTYRIDQNKKVEVMS